MSAERMNKLIQDIWIPLMKTNGEWDEQKIKNELHDLVFVVNQVPLIYEAISKGKLSKHNYYASTIISELEENFFDKGITRDDLNEMIENSETLEDLVSELKDYFEL